MIDLEKAEIEFDNYAKNYDIDNENIKLKFYHSHKVENIAGEIAKSINLSEEEIELAKLVGLLHDIARFEQYTRFQTFSDLKSIDHADEYDNIIFKAVKNHNKFKIEDGLTEKELLYSKIARDADKIDIFFEVLITFYTDQHEKDIFESELISDEILEQVLNHKTLLYKPNATKMDSYIAMLCLTFDLNFKYSYEIMQKEDYINKIINRFNFKNEETRKKIEIIRNEINNYIQTKKG